MAHVLTLGLCSNPIQYSFSRKLTKRNFITIREKNTVICYGFSDVLQERQRSMLLWSRALVCYFSRSALILLGVSDDRSMITSFHRFVLG